jgi:thymidylate synthase (FAD)
MTQSVLWDESNPTEDQCIAKIQRALSIPYRKEGGNIKTKIETAIKQGHLSVLEHANISLDCLTNIETYKDYTRHRHCAFTIESTSFVKYTTFCLVTTNQLRSDDMENAILNMERVYEEIEEREGIRIARDFLLQSQAARMYMTTNIREWRYIIGLRGDPNDNALTRDLRNKMWTVLNEHYPFFFPLSDCAPLAIPKQWGKQPVEYCSIND